MLPKKFTAVLEKSPNHGGWTYVSWDESAAFFKTKGIVKVKGTIDGKPFEASFMAMGDSKHMLPVKAELRKLIGKEKGDKVEVIIKQRLK